MPDWYFYVFMAIMLHHVVSTTAAIPLSPCFTHFQQSFFCCPYLPLEYSNGFHPVLYHCIAGLASELCIDSKSAISIASPTD